MHLLNWWLNSVVSAAELVFIQVSVTWKPFCFASFSAFNMAEFELSLIHI